VSESELAAVEQAAEALLRSFAAHDREGYFAAFAPDATFVFHNHPAVLFSRADYERTWREWEAEGFHVDGCESVDRRFALVAPDVVIMTHRVRTRLAGVTETQHERETIVFRREPAGDWLAIHEHLSQDPSADA
jgi:ketosteroid isomerase-like protein